MTALKNCTFFPVNEKDLSILNHLTNITINQTSTEILRVDFYFNANDFFSNEALFKEYHYDTKSEEVIRTKTSLINWKSEDAKPFKKVKTTKKKNGKSVQTITKEIEVESFFDIFKDKEGDEMQGTEAEFFKDDLIPFSLEYYLNYVSCGNNDECDKGCC